MSIVRKEERMLSSDGKTELFLEIWADDAVQPKAVLQISHGMWE